MSDDLYDDARDVGKILEWLKEKDRNVFGEIKLEPFNAAAGRVDEYITAINLMIEKINQKFGTSYHTQQIQIKISQADKKRPVQRIWGRNSKPDADLSKKHGVFQGKVKELKEINELQDIVTRL
uniref:Uncharacterized protein n=1 Tax=Panagrolaimus sp. JU765 TaxID=591449 RepID=A0AC34R732_9BILA